MRRRLIILIRRITGACILCLLLGLPVLAPDFSKPPRHGSPQEIEQFWDQKHTRQRIVSDCCIAVPVLFLCWLATFAEPDRLGRRSFRLEWSSRYHAENSADARPPLSARLRWSIAVVLIIVIARFVWPTPYQYGVGTDLLRAGVRYRTSRITGKTEWYAGYPGTWIEDRPDGRPGADSGVRQR